MTEEVDTLGVGGIRGERGPARQVGGNLDDDLVQRLAGEREQGALRVEGTGHEMQRRADGFVGGAEDHRPGAGNRDVGAVEGAGAGKGETAGRVRGRADQVIKLELAVEPRSVQKASSYQLNTDKVTKLGFRPKISFEEGLNAILRKA